MRSPTRRLAVTDDRYRVILEGDAPARIYDLANDPGENMDIASTSLELMARLNQRYVEFMARDTRKWFTAKAREMDATQLRGMRGLGYTDGEDGDH